MKMEYKNLIKSKWYWLTKVQNTLYRDLKRYLKDRKINQTQFANENGFSKGYISQILNDGSDHRLSKFFELYLAMGKIPKIEHIDIDEYLSELNLEENDESVKVTADTCNDENAKLNKMACSKNGLQVVFKSENDFTHLQNAC